MADHAVDWRRALERAGVSPDDLSDALREQAGLSVDTPVFLAGSVAEGAASAASDVDLYALVLENECRPGVAEDRRSIRIGGRTIDFTVIAVSFTEALVSKLESLGAGRYLDTRLADSFSFDECLLLHRLAQGLAVRSSDILDDFRERTSSHIAGLNLTRAHTMVKRRQRTAQALYERSDWVSLLFMIRDICDASADMLLAAEQDGGPPTKWRYRRLLRVQLPEDGALEPYARLLIGDRSPSVAATYLALSTFPPDSERGSVMAHAHRVCQWSRSICLYIALRRAGAAPPAPLPGAADTPPLRLDTHLAGLDHRFALTCLSRPGDIWEISPMAAQILCARPPDQNSNVGACDHEVQNRFFKFLRLHGFTLDAPNDVHTLIR